MIISAVKRLHVWTNMYFSHSGVEPHIGIRGVHFSSLLPEYTGISTLQWTCRTNYSGGIKVHLDIIKWSTADKNVLDLKTFSTKPLDMTNLNKQNS